MAAPPFDTPLPGASFFDIYNDAAPPPPPRSPVVSLPSGGCNFVDLTPGANGTKCGCRHFWTRFAAGRAFADSLGSDHSTWCMCSHHACYHDFDRVGDVSTPGPPFLGIMPGQENQRPRVGREPLSPVVQEVPTFRPSTVLPGPVDDMNLDAAVVPLPKQSEEPWPREHIQPSAPSESTLQDTLNWGEFLQSQPQSQSDDAALPPIPQQCLMPSSQPSSTTSSSQARYLRPFAGKGLSTLSGVGQAKPRSPLHEKEKSQDAMPLGGGQEEPNKRGGMSTVPSAPGADTPRAGTPTSRAKSSPAPEVGRASAIFGAPSRETFQHLSDTVQGYEQRLDRLENVSFSAVGHDECDEKHDSTDLRVTDLEHRMEEVEKLANDDSSHGTARRVDRPGVDESTNSVVSVSTSATRRAVGSSEVYSHIQSLQSQLTQLRSYVPSYSHAWEVEVVFLPFPLRRIWQERHDFNVEQATTQMDEWTQVPETSSAATIKAQSPLSGEWAEPGLDYTWLLPRAWGANSLIDKRLKSRGLVRTASIKGPDARSVQVAMQEAFGSTLSDMATAASPASNRRSVDGKAARFFGLQQHWVPLRKIHKDNRLRFLSPAEMVTPSSWDVSFLNSVVMRASERRLFVTQPEAYLQHLHAYDSGWTWQKVRELSRVYPDPQESQEVPEADALEDYWTWNEKLDEPASAQSSMSHQQHARQRVSTSPSQQFFTLKSSLRSPTPRISASQARERQSSRPLRVRTTSMPPMATGPYSPAGVRRRVISYGQQHQQVQTSPLVPSRSSPAPALVPAGVAAGGLKRRRTRSPTHPRNTPRFTTSPSPGLLAGLVHDRPAPRGVTPQYYATPFSNGPPTENRHRGSGGGSGDGMGTAFGLDDDDDYDHDDYDYHAFDGSGSTNIYEDDDASDVSLQSGQQQRPHVFEHHGGGGDSQLQMRQPEDEPWPGIEDQDHISDEENIDPLFSSPTAEGGQENAASVASSQPSEYPSTQRGWQVPEDAMDGEGAGFHIHEDEQMPDSQ